MSFRAIPRTLGASRIVARHGNAGQLGGTISVAPPVRSPATRSFTEATPPCIQKELCSCSSKPSIVASAALIGISMSLLGYSSLASGREDNRDSRKAALCQSEGESSACTDKETFVSAVADSIPEQNRYLDRKRFAVDLNAWNKLVSATERALTVGSADEDDEESDCSTTDELPADLPPIQHVVEAKATAPLIDPKTGMTLENAGSARSIDWHKASRPCRRLRRMHIQYCAWRNSICSHRSHLQTSPREGTREIILQHIDANSGFTKEDWR